MLADLVGEQLHLDDRRSERHLISFAQEPEHVIGVARRHGPHDSHRRRLRRIARGEFMLEQKRVELADGRVMRRFQPARKLQTRAVAAANSDASALSTGAPAIRGARASNNAGARNAPRADQAPRRTPARAVAGRPRRNGTSHLSAANDANRASILQPICSKTFACVRHQRQQRYRRHVENAGEHRRFHDAHAPRHPTRARIGEQTTRPRQSARNPVRDVKPLSSPSLSLSKTAPSGRRTAARSRSLPAAPYSREPSTDFRRKSEQRERNSLQRLCVSDGCASTSRVDRGASAKACERVLPGGERRAGTRRCRAA